MTSAKGAPVVTVSTDPPHPPPRGAGPEIRLWPLTNHMLAVQFVATGDLYVVNRTTAIIMMKRASKWTMNQDG